MNFKFSLAQLTVLNTSPVEISKIAADCGYDFVSFRQIYMNLPGEANYDLQKNKKLMKETKEIFKETGIKLLDVELAKIYDGMNVKNYEPAMLTACELGGKHILSSIWTENKEYYIEKFGELCDLAKKYNLTVDLEYVPIAGVKNLEETKEVLYTVNKSNAGIMIDMHHLQRAKDNPKELIKIPKEWFNFAHICDASTEIPTDKEEMTRILREERDYVGEGGIDIAQILNNMPIIPYSIELPNLKKVAEYGYKEHAKKCLDTARAYCEKYVKGRTEEEII